MWKVLILAVVFSLAFTGGMIPESKEFHELFDRKISGFREIIIIFVSCSFLGVLIWLGVKYFRPLNYVVELESGGYPNYGMDKQTTSIRLMQQMRKSGNCPPVYPNGWYGLIESQHLARSQTMSLGVLGLTLALFRDEKGEAYVLDAYCPHMGANLGAGGQVKGHCIECPFHGWMFRGDDGKCEEIPYLDSGAKIPESARVKSYHVTELNGWIMFWYDAENREPFWNPPEIEEITQGAWVYRGRTQHTINAHIEEIPENAADVAHLGHVHGATLLAGIDLRFIFNRFWSYTGKHNWTAAWEQLEGNDKHIGQLKLYHCYTVYGLRVPFLDFHVVASQIGPGIVYLKFNHMFGNGAFLQSLTPIGPLMQKLVQNIYSERKMPTFIAKILMMAEAKQVERDLMIWNNKTFIKRPIFVKSSEDSLVAKHRRWYSQFYSENSPTLKTALSNSLDW